MRFNLRESERTGEVIGVDYWKRRLTIDRVWPGRSGERVFEIGAPGRMTTYTAARTT